MTVNLFDNFLTILILFQCLINNSNFYILCFVLHFRFLLCTTLILHTLTSSVAVCWPHSPCPMTFNPWPLSSDHHIWVLALDLWPFCVLTITFGLDPGPLDSVIWPSSLALPLDPWPYCLLTITFGLDLRFLTSVIWPLPLTFLCADFDPWHLACPHGTFGKNCLKKCRCYGNQCDGETGKCLCRAGRYGRQCNKRKWWLWQW